MFMISYLSFFPKGCREINGMCDILDNLARLRDFEFELVQSTSTLQK